MNTIKRKPLFYDLNPRHPGKYNNNTVQLAVKRLYYIKHLRLTNLREHLSWKVAGQCRSFKRLFKLCRSLKTSFELPNTLATPLKMSRLNRLSITYPCNPNLALLKRAGNRYPINKLSVHLNETYSPQQLNTLLTAIHKRKQAIPSLKLQLPKKSGIIPTQKGIEKLTKVYGKVKGLQVLKLDSTYFSKQYLVKSFFKTMVTWNITLLVLTLDLKVVPGEILALALSNLASMKTLKGLEMEWGNVEVDAAVETHMEEVVRAFITFLKNQFRLNSLTFKHRGMQGTCSLIDVYKNIGKLKYLESLCLYPTAGEWKEKDIDAFVTSIGGHPKLKRLELHFSELPENVKQFYMKLNAGLNGIKKVDVLKINGAKNCGFSVEDATPLQNIFKSLLKLEFNLLLQYNARRGREADVQQQKSRGLDQAREAAVFAKLISGCNQLQEVVLGINPGGMINEGPLITILTGLLGLDLSVVDLSIGRIKREGPKNIFLNLVEKMDKMMCFRLRIGESYFVDEEVISMADALIKKKKLYSVIVAGSFQWLTKEVKDYFVTRLRTHSIKTPPLQ